MRDETIQHQRQQVLLDKKWQKFLRRMWLFRHIPFVSVVLAAGSMALGNVHPESDFDVIIGAGSGRIFTTRFFAAVLFSLFGWRRTKLSHKETATDKICLNHFVTPAAYRLSSPHNEYWKKLYFSLVPVYGAPEKISQFWASNADWLGEIPRVGDDLRHQHKKPSKIKLVIEYVLSGKKGDWLEAMFKKIQISRIERGLKSQLGHQPRIIYNDNELEFHPDTKRIDDYLKGGLR